MSKCICGYVTIVLLASPCVLVFKQECMHVCVCVRASEWPRKLCSILLVLFPQLISLALCCLLPSTHVLRSFIQTQVQGLIRFVVWFHLHLSEHKDIKPVVSSHCKSTTVRFMTSLSFSSHFTHARRFGHMASQFACLPTCLCFPSLIGCLSSCHHAWCFNPFYAKQKLKVT